jgi:nucleotide-binding universal stress UspA family protein
VGQKKDLKERYQQQREKQNQQQQDQQQHQHQRESEAAKINLEIDMVDLIGSVAGTIVSYAEEKEADLVVIGTKGVSWIKRMLLGSVAEGHIY